MQYQNGIFIHDPSLNQILQKRKEKLALTKKYKNIYSAQKVHNGWMSECKAYEIVVM